MTGLATHGGFVGHGDASWATMAVQWEKVRKKGWGGKKVG